MGATYLLQKARKEFSGHVIVDEAILSMLNVREHRYGRMVEKLKMDKHVIRVSMGDFLFSIAGFIIIYSDQIYFSFKFGLFNYGLGE